MNNILTLNVADTLLISEINAKHKRAWVVPQNDLEANYILALLRDKKEEVYAVKCGWGADWNTVWKQYPHLVDYQGLLFGIELMPNGIMEHCHSIDHHKNSPKKKLSNVERLHFFKWLEDNRLSNAEHTRSYGTKELYDELSSISAEQEDYYYLRELNRLLYKPTTRI